MKTLLLILTILSLPLAASAQDLSSDAVYGTVPPTFTADAAPRRTHRAPRRSAALVVLGSAVMIPTGALMLAVSIPFWADGLDLLPNSTPGISASDRRDIAIASAFTAASLVFVAGGSLLISIGNRRVSERTARWLRWTPSVAYSHGTATIGIGGSF